MSKPIHVLSGPNLNLLGVREPEIYGRETLADIEAVCRRKAEGGGCDLVFRQTNSEGELIGWVQEAREAACALIINPAGLGHTSIALLDALKMLACPIIECHLSNPARRDDFRRSSYVSLAATGLVSGFGAASYALAVDAALGLLAAAAPAGAD
ncbi:MAG: type II 3-dehydroquinate dehydratase [Caulobacteraceae bacterium]